MMVDGGLGQGGYDRSVDRCLDLGYFLKIARLEFIYGLDMVIMIREDLSWVLRCFI